MTEDSKQESKKATSTPKQSKSAQTLSWLKKGLMSPNVPSPPPGWKPPQMKERITENQEPLNQASKKALLQLKQSPDPNYLYALQLVDWALENKKVNVGYQVNETLAQMFMWPPKDVLPFLEWPNPDDPNEQRELLKPRQKPLGLAWAILDSIEDRLQTSIGYDKQKKV